MDPKRRARIAALLTELLAELFPEEHEPAREAGEPLLSVRDAATLLGVTSKSVRGLIRTGELPASKVGPNFKIARADLDAYVAAARVEPPAEPPESPAGASPSPPPPLAPSELPEGVSEAGDPWERALAQGSLRLVKR